MFVSTCVKCVRVKHLLNRRPCSLPIPDYGMRAVMAVLRAAGNLKRRFPQEDEYVLMVRAAHACRVPHTHVQLCMGPHTRSQSLNVTRRKACHSHA